MGMRPTWIETFMDVAKVVAKRSTCLRRQVGAVLVQNKHIIATGHNGAPAGMVHCLDIGCVREQQQIPSGERHELCRAVHAEQNVIIQAALHGRSTRGSELYVTLFPCAICAKMIVAAGIETVYCEGEYPDQLARDILSQGGVTVIEL